MHYGAVSDADEEPLFLNPLMWWLYLLMGFVGLGITLGVGVAFGRSAIDMLLLRGNMDVWWEMSVAFDYAVIALGLYLMVRQALSKPEE